MQKKTQVTECTIPVSEFLSLRLYSDTSPHYHHVAHLQKGLILVYQGKELVGEGTGFGVPIVRYRNKTYFSGSSTVQVFKNNKSTTVLKQFALDMISERRFRRTKIDNEITRKLRLHLDEFYQKHRHWRLLTLANLSKIMGVQQSFVRVKPKGKVAVIYHIEPPFIFVKAAFKLLEKHGLQRIFLLNEQGARHFRKYLDSNGTVLFDKQIGAWESVEAKWACVFTKSGQVGFRLWRVKGAVLRVGREYLKDTFDWIGLDYEFSPEKTSLEYDIEILRRAKQK